MRPTLHCLAILCVLCASPVHAENWPDWREPQTTTASRTRPAPLADQVEREGERRLVVEDAGQGWVDADRLGQPNLPHEHARGSKPEARTQKRLKKRRQGRHAADRSLAPVGQPPTARELWRRKLAKAGRGARPLRRRERGVRLPDDRRQARRLLRRHRRSDLLRFRRQRDLASRHPEGLRQFLNPARHASIADPLRRPPLRRSHPQQRPLADRSRQGDRQGSLEGEARKRRQGGEPGGVRLAGPVEERRPDADRGPRRRLRHRPSPRGRQGSLAARRAQSEGAALQFGAPHHRLAGSVARRPRRPDRARRPHHRPQARRQGRGRSRQSVRSLAENEGGARRPDTGDARRPGLRAAGENSLHPMLGLRRPADKLYAQPLDAA